MAPLTRDLTVSLAILSGILLVTRWIYRLTLHPLAKFPGPKGAALSSIFAMMYDIPTRTSYVKEFPAWHVRYGPIIRIEPNHLHILDMDAYKEVHKTGSKFNKDFALYSYPFSKGSIVNVLSNKQARAHRDMYAQFYSRRAITELGLESLIKEHLGKFLTRLDTMATRSEPIDLTRGFKCLTADTILRYIFNRSFHALDAPQFRHPLVDSMEDFMSHWTFTLTSYFPRLMGSIAACCIKWPEVGGRLNKSFACALKQVAFCQSRVLELSGKEEIQGPCVFHTALKPNLLRGHSSLDAITLGRDAWIHFFAGTDTSAGTLAFGVWYLLNDPESLRKLQQELKSAIADSEDLTVIDRGWSFLETLPFLKAVVKESLRLYYGVPGRNPRVVPPEGAILCGRFIPGGTVISMSCYTYHHNPAYFASHPPDEFRPERWMDEKTAQQNDRYWVPFSRGTRDCLGQNLGLASLYMAFAYVFRRFELELFETTKDDMNWHDALLPITFGHMKVKARRMQD